MIPDIDLDQAVHTVRDIAKQAGQAILNFYGTELAIEAKSDSSPLTKADLASHHLIVHALRAQFVDIPVLSEEAANIDQADRKRWKTFWLVDPLDGTKEFIKQTGYFTVNIALVHNGEPVLGVIYAPVHEIEYFAWLDGGAFFGGANGDPQSIRTRGFDLIKPGIVASRDHAGPKVEALLKRFPDASTLSIGSSLKFCLIAEGKADVYLRDVPTMEWDTAAAQCIVEQAGGLLLTLSGERLLYNKESLVNPQLLTVGDRNLDRRLLFNSNA